METYNIEGLNCAACATSAQKVLSKTEGVEMVRVNYATKTAAVEYGSSLSIEDLNQRLEKLGYQLHERTKNSYKERHEREEADLRKLRNDLLLGAAFGLPLFVIAMFIPNLPYANYIMLGLTLPILFWSGRRFFVSAAKQLTVFKANMDTLVALGAGTAFLFSLFNTFFAEVLVAQGLEAHVYYEGVGMLLVFILFGKYLEGRANLQTATAIEELVAMQVPEVHLIEDGEEKTLPIEIIQVGDVLKVRPGETVPLDAEVLEGQATVDESMLTGEPMGIIKRKGDQVFGGTILSTGSLTVQVTQVGEDTVLAQIIKLVEEAQNSQVPVQQLVDKVSAVFVPSVIVVALLTFGAWFFWGTWPQGVVAAVAVLVVACPCALGLATPTAIMIGVGEAAKQGVLIRQAAAIEHLSTIDTVVLDKTGTITEGEPRLTAIEWQEAADKAALAPYLVSLENESEHPIAQTLVDDFADKGIAPQAKVSDFENITGLGVKGRIEEQWYWVGNEKLMQQEGIELSAAIQKVATAFEEKAYTLAFFANEQEVLAVMGFSDTIKQTSAKAIAALHERGLEVVMLTGDHQSVAEQVAQEVGIDTVEANVLPQDKIAYVKDLQAQGKSVMMVGDGINDAPALAQANVGVAMNNGTSVAIGSASIVLRKNNLDALLTLLNTSQQMLKIIRQNLFWAFIYNVGAIPIAAMGWLNPMVAGAAMAFSSVSVVMNSLRLKS